MIWFVFHPVLLGSAMAGGMDGMTPKANEPGRFQAVQALFATKCAGCHGPEKQRANLRLDIPAGFHAGGDSGPLLEPGKPDASRLLDSILGKNGQKRMPPKGEPLTEGEVALVRAWITDGARMPAAQSAQAEKPRHWAFQPIANPPVPAVAHPARVRNPIDAFVLARLDREGIQPSPEADPVTLMRRVSLDLTGLPADPAVLRSFLKQHGADAYERWVEHLLAQPAYGERWARVWLDQARYADSNGYSIDAPRSMWPWRDWVIQALNADMPFDRFTIEQMAGDLLPGATTDQKVATGFHRNTQINEEGGVDKEQFRIESVFDRVATTGAVWTGLTLGCAQCHNHKFDPVSQREYYRFFAFFNNQDEPALTLQPAVLAKEQPEAKEKDGKKAKPKVEKPAITTLVLAERSAPRETKIFLGGDFTRPGMAVDPGTPAVLPPLEPPAGGKKPNRLDLARWLVSRSNPLTARVQVNRHWGYFFGLPLVETENDFGIQGTPPSHPDLLDWLATRFMDDGWSMKKLHRLIVTSATYRQSSAHRPDLETSDPRNKLLARQKRIRLEAEAVRDSALVASGLFSAKVGGPSVFPPQPPGVDQFTQVKRPWVASEGPDRYRRGLYTHFWRAAPYPGLTVFDAPDAGTTCTRRNKSNTPLQALTLLNDQAFGECAHGLALRVGREGANDPAGRMFELAMSRQPETRELDRLNRFLALEKQRLAANPKAADDLMAQGGPPGKELAAQPGDAPDKAARVLLARLILNLDEFITRE